MKDADALIIAGTRLPAAPAVTRAIEFAREASEPYLFNHVMRSWLFAVRIGEVERKDYDAEVLALATLLHDVTLDDRFAGPRRFEVEAADIARKFALEQGFEAARAQQVWDGVALNSTPSIGLFKEEEVALCTAGICFDVVGLQFELLPTKDVDRIVEEFPRLGMKSKMAKCFCHMAASQPQTTYESFVRDFGERHVPGYERPSAVDWLANAPFAE